MKLPQNCLHCWKAHSALLTVCLVLVGRREKGEEGGAQRVQQPAVCLSLSAIWWAGDELEMSDGLPVRAQQLWVAGRLPQGWPDGSYSSLALRQVLWFMRPCNTQIHAVIQKNMRLQTYKDMWKQRLKVDGFTFTVLEIADVQGWSESAVSGREKGKNKKTFFTHWISF